MNRVMVALLTVAFFALSAAGQSERGTLDIYLVDVEGGNATLLVTPAGESLLIDTGNGGENAARDVDRIVAAAQDAGLERIDHLVTTHWHGDHFGGMEELASRMPVRHFIDHGPNIQSNPNTDSFLETIYPGLYRSQRHTVVRPGDQIPIAGVDVTVLASAGEVIQDDLPGGGEPNPFCSDFMPQAEDTGENAQSVGSLITFGEFRALHLGDLTVNTEFDLMCPNNPIGTVDLFVVSHHGQPNSNATVLVHAIESRVAIMNNGTRKGGQPEAMQIIHSAPGLEDLWQLHFSVLSGQEYTVPGIFIANPIDEAELSVTVAPLAREDVPTAPVHDGPAFWIKVSAEQDGSFTVTNSRNGFSKRYRARTD